ncbi:PP2C family protein-serine/threonine phosphatase [Actinorugispora endophytica]|uniref:Stage II sporulation protein E n=1 Tax=Actinorugispora endophytica TaxID=1605990 RepID=A0A4R6V0F0_9ACTN|nr:PP2C family protein-serine/threonine phosphatase [Actinorugispora endophytica]TDQ51405.1 stage II sporulation protein E [Actinorugispora endophytica]
MLIGTLFAEITRAVGEPMLLLSLSGRLLGRNTAMHRLCPDAGIGANLYDLVLDEPARIAGALRGWARSAAPVAGSLVLRAADGAATRCHCFGGRAAWVEDDEPAVQVRLVPSARRDHFRRLTEARESEFRLRGRIDREHEIAVGLQRSLLPERVDGTPLRVAVGYVPTTRGAEVGGDWYDVFPVPGPAGTDRTALVIGDVAGHGLPEAAVMSQLRSVLRATALDGDVRPDRAAARLDGYIGTYLPTSMATMCYVVHDPTRRTIAYSNAGHVPPILLRRGGGVEVLDAPPDPPLGCALGEAHHRREVPVGPGDLLVLYTDGVVERRDEAIDIGIDRLGRLVADQVDPTPESVCAAVMAVPPPGDHPDDRAVLAARF